MPYRRSKYSDAQTNEWKGRAAVVLAESEEAMNIDQIKGKDMVLSQVTPQKMARMLNALVEQGFAAKAKNRDGRVIYKSLAVMERQGYDISEVK